MYWYPGIFSYYASNSFTTFHIHVTEFFFRFRLFLIIIGKNPLRNFLVTIPNIHLPIRTICVVREHWVKNCGKCKQEDADLLLPSGFLNPHQKHYTLWRRLSSDRATLGFLQYSPYYPWTVWVVSIFFRNQILDVLLIETIKALLIETIRHDRCR